MDLTEAHSVFPKTVITELQISTVGSRTSSLPITMWLTQFVCGHLPRQILLCGVINLSNCNFFFMDKLSDTELT